MISFSLIQYISDCCNYRVYYRFVSTIFVDKLLSRSSKSFCEVFSKKFISKRHFSITNKKELLLKEGVDLRLKVQNMLFTTHVTLTI